MTDLTRLVYHSKNLLSGSDAELEDAIAQILGTSQRNNARCEVTGALLFNEGAFAQVLEGPRQAVEATFERIQRDMRHGEVMILQCAPVSERGFPNWSMAFVGRSAHGRALWHRMAEASGFDPGRLDADEVFAVLRALVLEEEGFAPEAAPAPDAAEAEVADAPPRRASFEQVAEELRALMRGDEQVMRCQADALAAARSEEPDPEEPDAEAGQALIELAILKAALKAERERSAELSVELDEMQAGLAASEQRTEELRRERDRWRERAKLLALPVFQEPASLPDPAEGAGEAGPAAGPYGPSIRRVI